MLSAWLQHVEVQLSGATFEHRSFDLLTDSAQPWLVAAMRDVRFDVRLHRLPGTKACLLAVCRTTPWLCDPKAMLRGKGRSEQLAFCAGGLHLTRTSGCRRRLHCTSPAAATPAAQTPQRLCDL